MCDDSQAVLIAYGSNLSSDHGSASQAFAMLVKTLQARGLFINKISRLWASQAWPDPNDPPYVNAVLQVTTDLAPQALLALLHEIEADWGRVRSDQRNAPRVIDLDLIAYGRVALEADGVIVPHPRAAERGFVMGPMAEIVPDWVHPVLNATARDLARVVTVSPDAHPCDIDL